MKYNENDLIRDADESKGHLCNSLSAIEWELRSMAEYDIYPLTSKHAERIANYIDRASATILYLRRKLEESNVH